MMKKRALDQISTAFDQAGMKLVAKRLSFSVSPETQNQCTLQVSGNTLRQSSNFTESRNRSYNVSPCVQNAPEKISEASPDGYTYGEAKTTSPTLFWPRLGVEPAEIPEIVESRAEAFRVLLGLLQELPSGKACMGMNERTYNYLRNYFQLI